MKKKPRIRKKRGSPQRSTARQERIPDPDQSVSASSLNRQLEDLSEHGTARTLRQDTVQRLQQLHGNAYVQRAVEQALAHVGPNYGLMQLEGEEEEGGNPVAPTLAGTSAHPTLRRGSDGPAVEELQQKLNADGASPPLVVDGLFGPLTRAAVVDFQTRHTLIIDGVVGPQTWGKIDELGLASTVGRVERQWEEQVGGQTYGMTSRYTWRIVGDEIRITVKLQFTGLHLPALVEEWFSAIRGVWNRYNAVNTETGEIMAITFDPQSVGSGADNVVQIMPGTGRADAGKWYAEDPDGGQTAAHEFGHMIGLEDEYQRTHGDYTRLTGEEPAEGVTEGDAPAADVAQELYDALRVEETAARVTAARGVIRTHRLQQGDFSQEIATAYESDFGVNIVDDIVARIPDEREWAIVDPFTHSSGSIMGMGWDHDHPVDSRHVREFVGYVQSAMGGEWRAEER